MNRKSISKRHIVLVVAVLLAVAMLLPQVLSGTAFAAEKQCRVRIGAGNPDTDNMLKSAGAVADLYLLAKSPQEGVYDYPGGFPDPEMDQEAWNKLAQSEARRLAGTAMPDISGVSLGTWTDVSEPGLYLVILRPDDATGNAYMKEYEHPDGGAYLASEILSEDRSIGIQIAPEIISLPGQKLDGNGKPAGWEYNLDMDVKPEITHRLGAVEIVKDLLTFEKDHDAFFLFQVEGYLEEEHVYSNLISMRFDNYGEQRVRLDNIPVGTELTISELYATPGYYLTGTKPADGKLIVDFDKVLEIRFENDYDGTRDKGDGIMNGFEFDPNTGNWNWTQK